MSSSENGAGDRLEDERRDVLDRIAALGDEWAAIAEAAEGVATDDEHDPEGATIAFERARVGALLGEAEASLADLEEARARLGDGRYGICERCGGPVGAERLAARPAARTCVSCAALVGS